MKIKSSLPVLPCIKCFVCHDLAEYICEGYSFCYKHAKEFNMGYGRSIKQMILDFGNEMSKNKL